MAGKQKVGSNKNLQRSGRYKGRNAESRLRKVKHARERHLKNAKQSCGQKFTKALEKVYQANPNPGAKAGRNSR